MKKITLLLTLTFLTLATTSVIAAERELTVSPAQSQLSWEGKKVTGKHDGTLSIKNGSVKLDNDKIVGGSFDIDMNSITVLDIKDPKDNAKLTNHLKSDDFFSASNFPAAKFTITETTPIPGAEEGQPNYNVSGDLSIKGITHPVSFPAIVHINGNQASANAEVKLDRTMWNVRYGSGKFFENLGDKLIYDEFTVKLNVVANG